VTVDDHCIQAYHAVGYSVTAQISRDHRYKIRHDSPSVVKKASPSNNRAWVQWMIPTSAVVRARDSCMLPPYDEGEVFKRYL